MLRLQTLPARLRMIAQVYYSGEDTYWGIRRMATERQIAANRKNARWSTGPRKTSKTRLNAVRHGILSRERNSRP